MPHIIIKAVEGASKEQIKKACERAIEAVSEALGKPERYFSAAVEEYSYQEWESVYNECIKDNDKVIIKPQYTNPKTFR
ncbi:MAG: 4-oxalocrotonate tautomerase family protein [Clostridiales bacterium]|jgi:phenylpyruvate tautomerase PptA (4-oxalocrotonate tautomerase family)|nr:4-oxalocrotonate tautomerase family protein [Clostridiales bacterium]